MTTTLSGGTLTITYTGTQTKLSRILLAAAEGLYHIYPAFKMVNELQELIPFSELTNTQKLRIIDQHVKRVIKDSAQDFVVNSAMTTARDTASAEDLSI